MNLLNPFQFFKGIVSGESLRLNWAAAAAAAVSYMGQRKASKEQREAAALAAEQSRFTPYGVTSGVGSGLFSTQEAARKGDPIYGIHPTTGEQIVTGYEQADRAGGGGMAMATLDPRYAQISQLLSGQAGGFLGESGMEQPSGIPLYQRGIQQALPFFQQASQIGSQSPGAGFLSQLNQFDPYQAAETQFGRLEDILNPARERTRGSLEARLLSQGRLGSTGGTLQQEGLETAIDQSRRQGLFDAFGQAQQTQQNLLGLGTGLNQQQMQRAAQLQQLGLGQAGFLTGAGAGIEGLGLGRQQSMQQLGLGALQGSTGLERMPLELLNLGGAFGGRAATAGAQQGLFTYGAGQNSSDATAAMYGSLGRGIQNTDWSGLFGDKSYNPNTGGGTLAPKSENQWANNWDY